MKPQNLLMLAIAIGCGIVAFVMTMNYLPTGDNSGPSEDMSVVWVTSAPVEAGTMINEQMLSSKEYPKSLVPENAILDINQIRGRAVQHTLFPNEIVTESKLAKPGVDPGLTAKIPEGMRALAIPVSTTGGVAGFIKSGSNVDIMLTMQARGNEGQKTGTILQNVKVLAVDMDMATKNDADQNKGRRLEMVTVLVTPEEATKLSLAQSAGQLSLVLRSGLDIETVRMDPASVDDLFTDKASKRQLLEEETEDPKSTLFDINKLDPQTEKPSAINGLLSNMFNNLKKKEEEQKKEVETKEPEVKTEPEPVVATAPIPEIPPIPQKKVRMLVYRDIQGNELMRIRVDADSNLGKSLKDLLEDPSAEEQAGFAYPVAAPDSLVAPGAGGPVAPSEPPKEENPSSESEEGLKKLL